jgi:hypothetical protein
MAEKRRRNGKENDDLLSSLGVIAAGYVMGLVIKNNLELNSHLEWGLENGWAAPPLIPTPSPGQTLAPPSGPQTLIGPVTSEKYPSKIKKTVNTKIEEEDKKNKKRHLTPSNLSEHDVTVLVECPDDLTKMKCSSNCWKGQKLYKITCSESERKAIYPSKTKTITVPPNFPNSVTITSGDQDDSYLPSNEDQSGQDQSAPTPIQGGAGKTIYTAVKHFNMSTAKGGIAGVNVPITYASDKSHRKIQSHRIDLDVGPQPNLEATVYLAWPRDCSGGGHPELAIKFWGPNHTGSCDCKNPGSCSSSCCYCYTSAVPDYKNNTLQLGFGGEGPHPCTSTIKGQVRN